MEEFTSNNFIEDIIINDLKTKKHDEIITRFPPEPNGYLHIGHAKSLCLNFGVKEKFKGKCNLRYDDTNPSKEDIEFVDSIEKDIKWLGFNWDNLFFASDYFDKMYECAVKLIKDGKAYVCDLSADEIRDTRGTLTQPGINSPYRNRSIDENLKLFEDMKNGKFKDGEKVLRAKIDMSSPNINMRDPIIYRILRQNHHRTGDKWIIYPMYDFAHPLEDAFENITHSLCTLEFEDHRPLYDWFKINCDFNPGPRQIEFARLNIKKTIMSKRYLKKLVDEKIVDGWSDPRMPTLSGMRERGYPPEAIKDFCNRIGVAKANSEIDERYLENCVREYLNDHSKRIMCIKQPIKVIIDNAKDEILYVKNNFSKEDETLRQITFSKEIYIEKDDFSICPPPKYKRLVPGGMVRLYGAYIIKYISHKLDQEGNPIEIHCELIENSKSGEENAKIKVPGVIQFVDAKTAIDCKVNDFDYLLLDGNGNFDDRINPNSKTVYNAKIEKEALNFKPYERFQFMRLGYYSAVGTYSKNNIMFNQIVSLKDSFKV